jgi:hypothetical protein
MFIEELSVSAPCPPAYLATLNVQQRRAVEHGCGNINEPAPLLIIAGAGSGKKGSYKRLQSLRKSKLPEARLAAQVAIKTNADNHASNVLPLIREAQKHGATSLPQLRLRRFTHVPPAINGAVRASELGSS